MQSDAVSWPLRLRRCLQGLWPIKDHLEYQDHMTRDSRVLSRKDGKGVTGPKAVFSPQKVLGMDLGEPSQLHYTQSWLYLLNWAYRLAYILSYWPMLAILSLLFTVKSPRQLVNDKKIFHSSGNGTKHKAFAYIKKNANCCYSGTHKDRFWACLCHLIADQPPGD